jgi:NAD(P)-dependent dehydrogenase (short-subunit alcohol dehydrogenase family)
MLGLGLVKELLKRDNAVVFAGARNPSAAPELTELVEKHPGKVHIIKLTSADVEDNKAAAAHIQSVAGRLDVVIANAGVMQYVGPSLEASVESVQEHFTVRRARGAVRGAG